MHVKGVELLTEVCVTLHCCGLCEKKIQDIQLSLWEIIVHAGAAELAAQIAVFK